MITLNNRITLPDHPVYLCEIYAGTSDSMEIDLISEMLKDEEQCPAVMAVGSFRLAGINYSPIGYGRVRNFLPVLVFCLSIRLSGGSPLGVSVRMSPPGEKGTSKENIKPDHQW